MLLKLANKSKEPQNETSPYNLPDFILRVSTGFNVKYLLSVTETQERVSVVSAFVVTFSHCKVKAEIWFVLYSN